MSDIFILVLLTSPFNFLCWSYSQIPVLCDSSLDLVVEVFDANGRVFDNFTSLNLQWHSSNQELLPLSYPQLHHNGKKGWWTRQTS